MLVRLILIVALLSACSGGGPATPVAVPTGRPEIDSDAVERHAREFHTDLARRPAGSQGEQAASVYLLGHLQRAGYVVLLDPVPVGDLVRSTNVVAQPPSGDLPTLVVVTPYDEGSSEQALGLLLELARAVRVAAPEHSVEFVALGAEQVGMLGSRRLAQELIDSDVDPVVVQLSRIGNSRFSTTGDLPAGMHRAIAAAGVSPPEKTVAQSVTVFQRAGFEHVLVGGSVDEVGALLLDYLTRAGV